MRAKEVNDMETKGYAAILQVMDETPEDDRKLLFRRLWSEGDNCGCIIGLLGERLGLLVPGQTQGTIQRLAKHTGLSNDALATLVAVNDQNTDADDYDGSVRRRFALVREYVAGEMAKGAGA